MSGFVLVRGGGDDGGGEGQLVMLQDGQAVLGLLLLQVEHLPQLLQLLQLTEGLQHHQHDHQPQEEVHWEDQNQREDTQGLMHAFVGNRNPIRAVHLRNLFLE